MKSELLQINVDDIRERACEILSEYMSKNPSSSYSSSNRFSFFSNPVGDRRQVLASQLMQKARNLDLGNLADFIAFAKEVSRSLNDEYIPHSYNSVTNSMLNQCIEKIISLHDCDEALGFNYRLSM